MGVAAHSCKHYELYIKNNSLNEVDDILEVSPVHEDAIGTRQANGERVSLWLPKVADEPTIANSSVPATTHDVVASPTVACNEDSRALTRKAFSDDLANACNMGNWQRAKSILLDSDSPLSAGFCVPLAAAVRAGEIELCRLLLERHPELDALNVEGQSLLSIAIEHESIEIANLIVTSGANKSVLDQRLADSCVQGDLTQARKLMRCGAGTKRALAKTVNKGKYSAVMFLMEQGAKLQQQQKDALGKQLQTACGNGSASTVNALLNIDASIDVLDPAGRTPLIIASEANHLQIIKALVKRGAGKEIRRQDGKDALEICLEKGNIKTAQFLVEAGAGRTILDRAARNLESDDANARAKACADLGGILSISAVEHVGVIAKRAVLDESKAVRTAALEALLTISAAVGALPPEVVQNAKDDVLNLETAFALNAYQLLEALGASDQSKADGVRRASEGVKHPDKLVRLVACNVLGSAGQSAAPCMPALLNCAIRDSNSEVRRTGCAALVSLHAGGSPIAEPDVRRHLVDASVQTAAIANYVLSELGQEDIYSEALAKRFGDGLCDRESETRKTACVALGKIGDSAIKYGPALAERAAKDEMWDVRTAALEALGIIGQGHGSRPAPPFIKIIVDRANHDPNRVVRNMAVETLGKMYRDGVELPKVAQQTLNTYQLALQACGSASMPKAR